MTDSVAQREAALEVERGLHDLSQPLTTLMCQLELGRMMGDAASLEAAVNDALIECRRLFDGFAAMRASFAGSPKQMEERSR